MNDEQWKVIKNFPSYSISSHGRVKRIVPGTNRHGCNYLLKPNVVKYGYVRVDLCKNGLVKHCLIHHLVLEAFVSHRPSQNHGANHINGKKADNKYTNLEWATQRENELHAVAHGLKASGNRHGSVTHPEKLVRGISHHNAKLTDDKVRHIRSVSWKRGLSVCLAKEFNVTPTLIRLIQKGHGWKNVTH